MSTASAWNAPASSLFSVAQGLELFDTARAGEARCWRRSASTSPRSAARRRRCAAAALAWARQPPRRALRTAGTCGSDCRTCSGRSAGSGARPGAAEAGDRARLRVRRQRSTPKRCPAGTGARLPGHGRAAQPSRRRDRGAVTMLTLSDRPTLAAVARCCRAARQWGGGRPPGGRGGARRRLALHPVGGSARGEPPRRVRRTAHRGVALSPRLLLARAMPLGGAASALGRGAAGVPPWSCCLHSGSFRARRST